MEMAMEEARPFSGEVEIDESYFGPRRMRRRRGRGAGGKTPVLGPKVAKGDFSAQ
jgi:transposase